MAAGATNVEERPIVGAPVDALVDLAEGSTPTSWSSVTSA